MVKPRITIDGKETKLKPGDQIAFDTSSLSIVIFRNDPATISNRIKLRDDDKIYIGIKLDCIAMNSIVNLIVASAGLSYAPITKNYPYDFPYELRK